MKLFENIYSRLIKPTGASLIGLATGGTIQDRYNNAVAVNVKDYPYRAKGDGVTNDTAAIMAAVTYLKNAGGGILLFPKGEFLVDSIVMPFDNATIHIFGAGETSTILKSNDPTKPVLTLDHSVQYARVEGGVYRDFGVRCHPTGDLNNPAHTLIDAQGFAACLFTNIRFYNAVKGVSGSAYAMFKTSSNIHLTYLQNFEYINIEGTLGPKFGLKSFADDYLRNVNLLYCRHWWINAVSQMEAGGDCSALTDYAWRDSLFEGSGMNWGLYLGNKGKIESNWFELNNSGPVRFSTDLGTVTSSSNSLVDNYFSGFGGDINIPAYCGGNRFVSNAGGTYNLKPAFFGDNLISTLGPSGGEPTLTKSFGVAGNLVKVSAELVGGPTNTWKLVYTFTPGAQNTSYGFNVNPPPNISLKSLQVGVTDGANGVAYRSAITSNGFYYQQDGANNALTIVVFTHY